MNTKPVLTNDDVTAMLAAGRAEAERNGWAVTIVVVDDGGHPLALQRLDGATASSAYIATEKARTSALGRRESKVYEDMINGGRNAFLSVPLTGMLEGGVPVLAAGQVVGAVGVSGVKSEQDAQVAKAAARAVAA
ncbi:MAG TPA: heme-binding protein [Albitalea sp.]|nr:heme-binding protein [Albitalea sp.]